MSELGIFVDSLEILEKFITDVMEAKKIVIFGASSGGKKALEILQGLGKKPVYFVDNDENKWGKRFEGIEILPPIKLKEIEFDVIVVASSLGEADILNQLEKMGFEDKAYTIDFIRFLLWAKRFFRKVKMYFFAS